MGRTSTADIYKPYIDIIKADLGIPAGIDIIVHFMNWRGKTLGRGTYYKTFDYGEIWVARKQGHKSTLETIMHELRHVWQGYVGKLESAELKSRINRRGRIVYDWYSKWEGKEYRDYSNHTAKQHDLYEATPWEIDARTYEQELTRLFPNYKAPAQNTRTVIKKSKTITMYKVKGTW